MEVLLTNKHFDLVIFYSDKLNEIYSSFTDLFFSKCVALFNLKQYNEALSVFDKANEILSKSEKAYGLKGK
jgi:tetratricopeptide (TPR) repeat protein